MISDITTMEGIAPIEAALLMTVGSEMESTSLGVHISVLAAGTAIGGEGAHSAAIDDGCTVWRNSPACAREGCQLSDIRTQHAPLAKPALMSGVVHLMVGQVGDVVADSIRLLNAFGSVPTDEAV